VLLALGGDRIPELGRAESLHTAELVATVTALGHGGLLGDIEDVEPGEERGKGEEMKKGREAKRTGYRGGQKREEGRERLAHTEVNTEKQLRFYIQPNVVPTEREAKIEHAN
jgi:hypothetical protein